MTDRGSTLALYPILQLSHTRFLSHIWNLMEIQITYGITWTIQDQAIRPWQGNFWKPFLSSGVKTHSLHDCHWTLDGQSRVDNPVWEFLYGLSPALAAAYFQTYQSTRAMNHVSFSFHTLTFFPSRPVRSTYTSLLVCIVQATRSYTELTIWGNFMMYKTKN